MNGPSKSEAFQPELPYEARAETEPVQPPLPLNGIPLELPPFVVELPSGQATTTPIFIEPLAVIRARGPAYAANYARTLLGIHGGSQANQLPRTMTGSEAAKYLGINLSVLKEVLPIDQGTSRWDTARVIAYRLDPRTAYGEV